MCYHSIAVGETDRPNDMMQFIFRTKAKEFLNKQFLYELHFILKDNMKQKQKKKITKKRKRVIKNRNTKKEDKRRNKIQ